jgi:hypothetical protein
MPYKPLDSINAATDSARDALTATGAAANRYQERRDVTASESEKTDLALSEFKIEIARAVEELRKDISATQKSTLPETKHAFIIIRTVELALEQGRFNQLVQHASTLTKGLNDGTLKPEDIATQHRLGKRYVTEKEGITAANFNTACREYIAHTNPNAQITVSHPSRRTILGALAGAPLGALISNTVIEPANTHHKQTGAPISKNTQRITNLSLGGFLGGGLGYVIGNNIDAGKLNESFVDYINHKGDIALTFEQLLNYVANVATQEQQPSTSR